MAYHMFFGFNLAEDITLEEVTRALQIFADEMVSKDLLHSMSPIAVRRRHPVLDTSTHIETEYFTKISFCDKAQADASVKEIYKHLDPVEQTHNSVIGKTRDAFFLCFEDQLSHRLRRR